MVFFYNFKVSLCYILSMKNLFNKRFYFYLITLLIPLIIGIVLLILGKAKETVFAFIPIVFCTWTFFSFFYPKDVQKHTFLLVLVIVSRFLCNLLSLLIPALIWKFVPDFSETVSYYFFLLPLGLIMVTYICSVTCNMLDKEPTKETGVNNDIK